MRKTVTILKQNLTLECTQDEIVWIDSATKALNQAIHHNCTQIDQYDKAILVASLDLLVTQLRISHELGLKNQELQQSLLQCKQASAALSDKIQAILGDKINNSLG